jgi:hypothetical protein
LGSQFFVPIVSGDYENVYNINIDCVGGSDGETYLTDGSGSSALRKSFSSVATMHGINIDTSRTPMSDNINFTVMGIPSFNFITADFLAIGRAHNNIDTPDRLYIPQIVRLADMIVDFITQCESGIYEADEITPDQPNWSEPGDATMVEHFRIVFNAARAGETVSFYEDFYKHYPDEEQRYFSFSESVEIDGQISVLREFGDFKLCILAANPGFQYYDLIYFHTADNFGLDVRISPMAAEETEAGIILSPPTVLKELGGLPGVHALYFPYREGSLPPDVDIPGFYFGFVFTHGGFTFRVSTMLNVVSIAATISGFQDYNYAISDADVYASIIQSLRFDEFVELWTLYQSTL